MTPTAARFLTTCLAILLLAGCGSSDSDGAGGTDPGPAGASQDVAEDAPSQGLQDLPPEQPDEGKEDIYLPFDISADIDLQVRAPEVRNPAPDTFSGCPVLGVSPRWAGGFEGFVTYDLESGFGDQPPQGLFLVEGSLNFEIRCLDQKLIVAGVLEGNAEAAGQAGEHPFAAPIGGEYDPITRSIDAVISAGEVRLFKVISIFFDGDFDGTVNSTGTFEGTWEGVHTHNDLGFIGDAEGHGTWTAEPQL